MGLGEALRVREIVSSQVLTLAVTLWWLSRQLVLALGYLPGSSAEIKALGEFSTTKLSAARGGFYRNPIRADKPGARC